MKTHNEKAMKSRSNVSTWVRSSSLLLLATALGLVLSAGCSQAEGSACNPTLSHNECDNDPTIQCVQPNLAMYPNCFGNAYCCNVTFASDGVTISSVNDTSVDNCAWIAQCIQGTAGVPDSGAGDSSASDAAGSEGG
jgi:hypothetical protein